MERVKSSIFRPAQEAGEPEAALQLHEMLIRYSRDIILLLRREDGRILAVNSAAENAYGYSRAQLLKMHIDDLRAAGMQAEASVRIGETEAEGALFESVHRRKDGGTFPVEVSSRGAIMDGVGILVSIIRDITTRKQAQEALAESKERYRLALDAARLGTWTHDFRTGTLQCDERARTHLGLAAPAVSFSEALARLHPEDRAGMEAGMAGGGVALTRKNRVSKEFRVISTDGKPRWIAAEARVYFENEGGTGTPIQSIGTTRDITQIRKAEADLRESEERFRTMADNISQFAWMADEKGRIFWFNKRWFDYTGTTLEEVQGWGWTKVNHPDHVTRVLKRIQHSWDTGEPWEDTFPMRGRDGVYRWFLSRALPIRDGRGRIVRWFGTNTDITERLQAEEQIRKSLREKESLLQEIHHRVKNNMQVINSLMSLQSSKIRDEALKEPFREASSRVNAMALIHDILYRAESLSEIELQAYFERLVASLMQMYNVSGVSMAVRAAKLHLSMDQAIPCGLIINELISNALKYAFPGGRRGHIEISVSLQGGNVALEVSDDGVGLPDDIDVTGLDTLGLKLVWGLAENQLDGRIQLACGTGRGTCFRIEFPRTTSRPSA